MTWAKYGTEYFDQLADFDFPADLDDACQLTHTQAIHYLYSTEEMGATFLKKNLRRIVSSPKAEEAARVLIEMGVWEDAGNRYRVRHHEEVFRQSLGYQVKERDNAKVRKQRERARKNVSDPDDTKGSNVTADVTRDVLRMQTDSQTTSSYREDSSSKNYELNEQTGELLPATTSDGGEQHEAETAPDSSDSDPVQGFFAEASGL